MAVTIKGSGQVPVQVIQATKNNAFTTTSTTYVDVTDMSVSITPTNSSNKVLIIVSVGAIGNNGNNYVMFQLVRNSTAIALGSVSRESTFRMYNFNQTGLMVPAGTTFLDSPATTSATTYKLQMRVTGDTGFLNRQVISNDDYTFSSITVMEISG